MSLTPDEASQVMSRVHHAVRSELHSDGNPLSLWELGYLIAGTLLEVGGSHSTDLAKQIALNESELAAGISDGLDAYANDYGITVPLADKPNAKYLN